MKEAAAIAKAVADKAKAGDPKAEGTTIGPVVNQRRSGRRSRASSRRASTRARRWSPAASAVPEGLNKGYYVRPTVFADVTNDMTIAREEIFGPCSPSSATRTRTMRSRSPTTRPMASPATCRSATPSARARSRARIRAGNVNLNGAPNERAAPFGGFKQSGNGREWGKFGLEEFLEVKAIAGYAAA